MVYITSEQARKFILAKHGLIGGYKFSGKNGVLDFVKQAGCIQFDPVDVCGKNAELVLQSRVKGFNKEMLYELLYTDRRLVDYFDKNLAIISIDDWPCFSRIRNEYKERIRSKEDIDGISDTIKEIISRRGAVCSKELDFNETVSWYWSDTRLSRAALETMYFRGDLIIHHKKGTIKYYDLVEKYIPNDILNAEDPFADEKSYLKWRVLRRIGAVGLLWNKASDAWLNMRGMDSGKRIVIFNALINEGRIIPATVDGIKESLYFLPEDKNLLDGIVTGMDYKPRCELIAPLDNLLWDRKLIKALFEFDYKWEIYTPESERKYGHYVIPLLYGDKFIGRVQAVCDRKAKELTIKNIWYEDGVKVTKTIDTNIRKRFEKFAEFNGCDELKIVETRIN